MRARRNVHCHLETGRSFSLHISLADTLAVRNSRKDTWHKKGRKKHASAPSRSMTVYFCHGRISFDGGARRRDRKRERE